MELKGETHLNSLICRKYSFLLQVIVYAITIIRPALNKLRELKKNVKTVN